MHELTVVVFFRALVLSSKSPCYGCPLHFWVIFPTNTSQTLTNMQLQVNF